MQISLSKFYKALCFSGLVSATLLAAPVTQAQVKVLPLGDSITEGYGSKSYRDPLVTDLDLSGCNYEMVGSRTSNEYSTISDFFSPHEGYSGHRVDYFTQGTNGNPGIDAIMTNQNPDVVLVHLGSNDLNASQSISGTVTEIDQLVTKIWNHNADAEIFIANVIPWYDTVISQNANIGTDISALGDSIENWVVAEADSRLHLVDVRSGYTSNLMQSDLIHPIATGDAHIADAFLAAMEQADVCPDTNVPNTTISDPSTAGSTLSGQYTYTGTASDIGTGVDRVRIAIADLNCTNCNNNTGNQWFNFATSTFGPYSESVANLTNISSTNVNWNFTATLPSGNYRLYALSVDEAGNQNYYNTGVWPTNRNFTVLADSIAPTATITTPGTNSTTLSLSSTIAGTASDTGGSGFDSVEIAIRLTGANGGWYDFNGGFSSTATRMSATLSNTTTTSTGWNLPVTLPAGNYRVQALVFDSAGNNSGWTYRTFVVASPDTDNPTGAITAPASNGDSLASTISGNASDTGGSGVNSVKIVIRSIGATVPWFDFNGGFSTTAIRADATLTNADSDSTNWSLPLTSLPPGNYRAQALVFDGSNNNSGWIYRDFSVATADADSPTGAITTPASNGDSLASTITGNASDTGGSGVNSVKIVIRSIGATVPWFDFNGGFSATATRADATLTNADSDSTNWSLPLTSLPPGNYRAQALVFDGSNNNSGWIYRDFSVATADTDNPTGAITIPTSDGDSLTTVIAGSATDTGSSGVESVKVIIRSIGGTNPWFDFNGSFTVTPTRADATLANTNSASTNWSLPVSLPAGNYRAQALVFDGANNNSGWIYRYFVVQ